MKAYVITTGALFAVLVLLHLWRAIVEGMQQFRDPFFVTMTAACAGLAVWAWRVHGKIPKG
jgi:hypothetical protein